MIEKIYDDIIMKTTLSVVDGKIEYLPIGIHVSLLDIKPNIPENGAFVFYDKAHPDKQICQIEYTNIAGKPELRYCTKEEYQRQGYMNIAMQHMLDWIIQQGAIGCLWLLIDKENIASIRVAQRFKFTLKETHSSSQDWYCLDLGTIS